MAGNTVSDRQLLLRTGAHASSLCTAGCPDVTPSSVDPALDSLSRDLVKALVAAGDSYTPGVPPAVRHSLDVLCTTAHKRGVPPEGVLALLKRTWKSYMSDADPRLGAHEMWYDELISQCIKDFYAAQGR